MKQVEVVSSGGLRAGDEVAGEVNSQGLLITSWGYIRVARQGGMLGFIEPRFDELLDQAVDHFVPVKEWNMPSKRWGVRVPRPAEEENEWGPVGA